MDAVSEAEIKRAVESAAHQIAAGVHAMLAELHMTVGELKALLAQLPKAGDDSALLDDLLAARNPHTITVSFLSDIAFVMGFEWKFNIKRIEPRDTDDLAAHGEGK